MSYWFTSDNHFFFHKNIIRYSNRSFNDVEDMHERMIEKWNAVVTNDDIVFCMGDFAFAQPKEIEAILRRLHYSNCS